MLKQDGAVIVMVHNRCLCYRTRHKEITAEAAHNISVVFNIIKIKVQLKENVYQHLSGTSVYLIMLGGKHHGR